MRKTVENVPTSRVVFQVVLAVLRSGEVLKCKLGPSPMIPFHGGTDLMTHVLPGIGSSLCWLLPQLCEPVTWGSNVLSH